MNTHKIKSEQEYTDALNEAKELWGAQIGTTDGDKLDVLIRLIEIYESERHPSEIKGEKSIIITPRSATPKYKLKDLLDKCDEQAPISTELTEWDNIKAVGKEYW